MRRHFTKRRIWYRRCLTFLNFLTIVLASLRFYSPQIRLDDCGFIKVPVDIDYIPQINISIIPPDIIVNTVEVNLSFSAPDMNYLKYYINNNDLDYSKIDEKTIQLQNHGAFNASFRFIHVQNVYANSFGIFGLQNQSVVELGVQHPISFLWKHPPGPVVRVCESLISLGTPIAPIEGRFFNSVLAPLMLFPEEIKNKSKIAVYQDDLVHLKLLQAIGFSEKQMVCMDRDEWAYAENFYTSTPIFPLSSYYGLSTKMLSEKLRRFYKIEDVIPDQYFFVNRRQEKRMRIKNFKEILRAANEMFPERNFSEIKDKWKLKDIIRNWSRAKFVFGPTGSNMAKHYFMAPGSVIVAGLADCPDHIQCMSAATHGVFYLMFVIVGMEHRGSFLEHSCDVDLAMRVIKIGLNCADQGCWDSNSSVFLI